MYENQRKKKIKIILLCDSVADCGDVGFTWSDSLHNLISDIIIVNIFHFKFCLEGRKWKVIPCVKDQNFKTPAA